MSILESIKKIHIPRVDYSRETGISFTQYSNWKECPHRWKLMHVDKVLPFTQNINLVFGTAMHETLQHYLKVCYNISTVEADKINLPEYLKNAMRENYIKGVKNNNNKHFSDSIELHQYYTQGVTILNYFKKNRRGYFPKKSIELLGIEMPINIPIDDSKPTIKFTGSIDIVLYDKKHNEVYIFDFKTSRRGWSDKEKKDPIKLSQLVLYKKYFAKQYGIDESLIKIEFIILKRDPPINPYTEHTTPPVSLFSPAITKKLYNSVGNDFEIFLKEYFDESGKPVKNKLYYKNINNCRFCPFIDKHEYCDKHNTDDKE